MSGLNEDRPEPEDHICAKPARGQFTLTSVLLLTAAIASWLGYFNARKSRLAEQTQLSSLQLLARELNIEDPQQYGAAMQMATYVGESIWNVYLPPDRDYQICIALESIPKSFGSIPTTFPPDKAVQKMQIESGTRQVELKLDRQPEGATIRLLIDGKMVCDLKRDATWNKSTASGYSGISLPKQQSVDKPLVLRQHTVTTPPAPPEENGARGAMVWIETIAK